MFKRQQLQLKNLFKARRIYRSSNDSQVSVSHVVKHDFTITFNNTQPQFPNFKNSIQSIDQGAFFKKNKKRSCQVDFIQNIDLNEKSSLNKNLQNQLRSSFQERNQPQSIYLSQNHSNIIDHPSQMIAVQADRPSSIYINNNNNYNKSHLKNISNNIKHGQQDSSLRKIMSPSSVSTKLDSLHYKKVNDNSSVGIRKNESNYNSNNDQNEVEDQNEYNIGSRILLPTFLVQANIYLKCPDQKQYKAMTDKIQEIKRRKIQQSIKNANVKKFR